MKTDKHHPENITTNLKEKGLRNTPHRRKIIGMLEGASQPQCAEQIFLVLKLEDTSISLSTVYRVLETLAKKGLVEKIHIMNEDRFSYKMIQKKHTHHFICLRCHKMIELPECPMESMEKSLKDSDNLQVIGHRLEIYGYCSRCH